MIPVSRYYYTLSKADSQQFVGVYSKESLSRVVVFTSVKDAVVARAHLERIKKFEPSNASIHLDDDPSRKKSELIVAPKIVRNGDKNEIRLHASLDRQYIAQFNMKRWSRPPNVDSPDRLITMPISEHELLSLPLELGIGVAIMWNLLSSDRHNLKYSCRVLDPAKDILVSRETLRSNLK
jgi:hypothetical protein